MRAPSRRQEGTRGGWGEGRENRSTRLGPSTPEPCLPKTSWFPGFGEPATAPCSPPPLPPTYSAPSTDLVLESCPRPVRSCHPPESDHLAGDVCSLLGGYTRGSRDSKEMTRARGRRPDSELGVVESPVDTSSFS